MVVDPSSLTLPTTLLGWAGLLVVAGVAALFLWSALSHLYRVLLFLRFDPVEADAVAPGEPTELRGTVEAATDDVTAPLGEATPVAYRTVLEQERRLVGVRDWRTLAADAEAVPFLVADDTGAVAVDPGTATVLPGEPRERRYLVYGRRPPDEVADRFDADGDDLPWDPDDPTVELADDRDHLTLDHGLFHGYYRLTEYAIYPGDTVHLRGRPRDPVPGEASVDGRRPTAVFEGEDDDWYDETEAIGAVPPHRIGHTGCVVGRGTGRDTARRLGRYAAEAAAIGLVPTAVVVWWLFPW